MNLWRHTANGGAFEGNAMLIADIRYTTLVRTLTDQHAGSDEYTAMGRAYVENQVQSALCAAGIFPESSEDHAATA
jgi:hypothetical protein